MKTNKKGKITKKTLNDFELYKKKHFVGSKAGLIIGTISIVLVGAGLSIGTFFIGMNNAKNKGSDSLVNVTLDAGIEGATFPSGDNKVLYTVKKGTKLIDDIKSSAVPSYKNHKFKHWKMNNREIPSNYIINNDITLKATYDIEQCSVTVLAGGNGNGTFGDKNSKFKITEQTFDVDKGTTLQEAIKDVTSPILHVTDTSKGEFLGWSTLKKAGTKLTDDELKNTKLESDYFIIYAIYTNCGASSTSFANLTFDAGEEKSEDKLTKTYNADTVPQTGLFEYNFKTYTSFSLSYLIDSKNPTTLKDVMEDKEGWYADPEGNYAGFDHWYSEGEEFDYEEELTTKTYLFNAHYVPHFVSSDQYVGETSEYKQDPWRAIVNNANKGLDNLHSVYAYDLSKNPIKSDSLVGLTRTLPLHGSEDPFVVRVIGENHDYKFKEPEAGYAKTTEDKHTPQSDFSGDTPIPLTFEFDDSNESMKIENFKEYFADNQRWINSNGFEKINNIKNLMPTYLADNLVMSAKSALKYYDLGSTGDSESGGESGNSLRQGTHRSYINLPSATEVGFNETDFDSKDIFHKIFDGNGNEFEGYLLNRRNFKVIAENEKSIDKIYDYYKIMLTKNQSWKLTNGTLLRTVLKDYEDSNTNYNDYMRTYLGKDAYRIRGFKVDEFEDNNIHINPIFFIGDTSTI